MDANSNEMELLLLNEFVESDCEYRLQVIAFETINTATIIISNLGAKRVK